jgi:hypothetical protein
MRTLFLIVSSLLLAACTQPLGPEYFYAAPTTGSIATVEGVTEDGGPMMEDHNTCVATIDGMSLPKRRWADVTKPVALTPGSHAVTICYLAGNRLGKAIIRLEAKADHHYVVRMERIYDQGVLRSPKVFLWVEDKTDGQVVNVKQQIFVGLATGDAPIVRMLSTEAPI